MQLPDRIADTTRTSAAVAVDLEVIVAAAVLVGLVAVGLVAVVPEEAGD
jgi:hypothetical protein